MATALKPRFGPKDHGRPLTLEEFLAGDYAEGYKYELIDGKLYVSPQPNLPEGILETWIGRVLDRYADAHPEIINFVCRKTRVFVPGRRKTTAPEPDVAAYRGFPLDKDFRTIRWQDVSPVLVVEVLSEGDPDKDLVRNVKLYLRVPSIKEYWLVDGRADPNRPGMTVYRRHGQRWRTIPLGPGESYTTRLLPGFELTVDPRA